VPLYRAAWLLPITQPPIRHAWLLTDNGRVVAFGDSKPGDFGSTREVDLGSVAVMPGVVNAHTHLELSWLHGRVPPTDDFLKWIRAVVALIYQRHEHAAEADRAILDAIAEAQRCGTALVGDISNDLVTSRPLAERNLAAVVFHELINFRASGAETTVADAVRRIAAMPANETVRHTLAAHAPYSVSPALFAAIREALGRDRFARSSVHLGETQAELAFLKDGSGPWRQFLGEMNAWDPSWTAPRCGPVEYLERTGFLDERVLAVHGVHLSSHDLNRLAARGATLVTCPRGNIRTGAGTPPIRSFYCSGVRVAVGTDSLASVPDLNLFSEIAEMRRLAPDVPARSLLESATLSGATALGFDRELGSIEAGKRDRLITIDVPDAVADIEEHLAGGVDPKRIRWLSTPASWQG